MLGWMSLGLVQLPTFYFTDPQRPLTFDLDVLGVAVRLTATPQWQWHLGVGDSGDFTQRVDESGDEGLEQVTDDPGGRYPDGDVTATYRTRGDRHPSVDLVWSGRFTAAGMGGPYPVRGTIAREGQPITVHVLEARAQLVHPG